MQTPQARLRARLAVMTILRDTGVDAGKPVFVAEIARHWPDYGIRASDLDGALEDLALDGLISRDPHRLDQVVRTRAGDAWFDAQPAWMEYQLLVPRAARAAYLRQHEARTTAPVRHRRREDAPPIRSVA